MLVIRLLCDNIHEYTSVFYGKNPWKATAFSLYISVLEENEEILHAFKEDE